LGELETAKARRRLIDVLIERASGNISPFLPFLRDRRWYLVRNVALILGAIGNPGAVGSLRTLVQHDDFRVRREALNALDRLNPREAMRLLTDALSDSSQRLRVFAARNLATRGTRAVEPLLTAVLQSGFEKRELSEIRSFYEALGYIGGPEVVAFLVGVVNRKNPLRRQRIDEIRAAACHALGWAGGPEAVTALKSREKDRSEIVREAAKSGLWRISAGREQADFEEEAA
jgi:HEAT repeat protein